MDSDQRPPTVFRIGPWAADAGANELRRGDTLVRVEPKAMEVLAVLAARPGQVVTREQLLDAVWPEVVVGDAALTQVIIKLRKALADDAQAPSYIETIPKRGYRLLPQMAVSAVVAEAAESAAAPTVVAPEPALPREASGTPQGRRRMLGMLSAGAALAAILGYGLLQPDRPADSAAMPAEAIKPPGEEQLAKLTETLPTLAVAPFESAGIDARTARLAKGIGWELAERLGRVASVRVVASDGRDASINRSSAARYLVTGFAQGEGDKIVVTAKLTDRQSGVQLWAGRFERLARDLLGVQGSIAQELVVALPIQVSAAERHRLATPYTRNLEAYDVFLAAQAAFLARSAADNSRARQLYLQAIAIDPQFARAYAGVALTHIEDYRLWKEEARDESVAAAQRMADAAFQIDPASREVHWVRSYLAMHERRFDAATDHLQQALAIDPSYADGYALLAWIHIFAGEAARAIPLMRTAMRLNPGAGNIYFAHLGTAYYFAGDQEQALINLKEARGRNLADVHSRLWLALSLLAAGHKDEALWEVDEIRALRPDFSGTMWLSRMPMKYERDKVRLREALRELAL